ncbi:purine nucleoside phosphorylase [Elysia marginata]|uniref:Purine nucleoside phosphorylase n=1 Tax=Elysia marginata TaxID=1093978 RepID=A0AAV4FVE7_9GAST|nr:purine nucleoside phosphorylase [Elysia marginata]
MAATNSDMSNAGYSYEDIQAMAQEILKYSSLRPKIGIICGTGLGGIADVLEDPVPVPYEVIPDFPVSTVKGHSGKFVFGTIQGKPVLLMMGRLHYYEGYPMWKVAMPVRVMKAVGIETLLITNAAGGMDPKHKPGDMMIIKDHIDLPGLTGECVLIGKNDERFGPRFLATSDAYDKHLGEKFKECMVQLGHGSLLHEGVYIMIGGPTFCNTAELKVLRMFGADAVGMSTVPEVVVGRHSGMRVFAMSLITDIVSYDNADDNKVTHEEVLKIAGKSALLLQKIFVSFMNVID